MSAGNQTKTVSDYATAGARRIRDLDVEIAALEGARDQVAGLLDEMDDRLGEQKRHRANLIQILKEREAELDVR